MIESGLIVFIGVFLLLAKLPRRTMLRLLHYDVALDIVVSVFTLAIHWGTFSGIMAATIAGLLTSVATTLMKRMFGHIKGGIYLPGYFVLKI